MATGWGRAGPQNTQFAALRGPVGPGDSTMAAVRKAPPPAPMPAPPMPAMVREEVDRLRRDFFVYSIMFASLASGTASQGAIQIQADSDFELQKLTQFAYVDGDGATQTEATRVLPLVSVQIQDTGTGRSLFNAPLPVPALFGGGELPFILPTTKMFTRNASVAVQVNNFGDDDYNLWLLLVGSKIFKY